MGKLIYKIGINDADYIVRKTKELEPVGGKRKREVVWECPYFSSWKRMLYRCYSEKFHNRQPSYIGKSVCKEWLTFSNFKSWMETQDWEGKELDKDILGDGKLYSPENCCFVSKLTNNFIVDRKMERGDWPIGVYFHKKSGKFMARCRQLGEGDKYLGIYGTPEEARGEWLKEKLRLAKILAGRQTDSRVATALIDRFKNYSENLY